MKKIFCAIIFLFSIKTVVSQNADNLIRKVGSFPENFVGKKIVLDKTYVWYRLEVTVPDKNNERFYKVTICDSESDCFCKLGIKTAIVFPVVKKKLAEQLINHELSDDKYKYISRISGIMLKKKLGVFNYVFLITKVEIYDETKSVVLETYQ